uniref:TATA box-binding protein-associated factor RNA polymerase I subunit D n=1 Tax=Geotrypetes seraphini TaxID=260995 RepID=A0A6P8NQB0_GEOSA|nr:TATA box-binding protein-associated factor RNA polymerase I subunit D [Geotrypetes seraphini]XP_033778442.1 TATA box-binding protein-associated factor RNA polymerase I subunit D [Geotrypetes seraphini]XP_033778443.1 TATA box-binding protein-associated factor RNA polymerase I subunit D [Geotrypetes seraphini]XP_033778444.1 TATA box-binding protein-associated factor RNA polymerase I subunit D [Geotrypetes seraphini]XP_033778446.1 TATA box-binding protein-associated factor RNA polymerase I subu
MDEEESMVLNSHVNMQNLTPSWQEELKAGKDEANRHVGSDSSQDEEVLEALRSECSYDDSCSPVTLQPASSSTVSQDLDSDSLSSGSSLFLTQCTLTPQRAARKRKSTSFVSRALTPASPKDSGDSSSGSTPQPTWRQVKYKKKKKRRSKRKKFSTGRPTGRPPLSISLEQRRPFKDKVLQFPFVTKELPFRMTFPCEQAAVSGFFQYVEKLKCKRYLQTSLHDMDKSEDAEEEFEVHKYKYLDEDGPISPIQEPNKESNPSEPDDYDVKIVENSCFILSSKLPSKTKLKKKRENMSGTR